MGTNVHFCGQLIFPLNLLPPTCDQVVSQRLSQRPSGRLRAGATRMLLLVGEELLLQVSGRVLQSQKEN